MGVPTKWQPTTNESAYLSDADFAQIYPIYLRTFEILSQRVEEGHDIVLPADGLGTGLAELPTRAPLIDTLLVGLQAALRAYAASITPKGNPGQ